MQGTEGHGVERPGPARPPRRAVTPPRPPVAAPVERGAMAVAIGCALPDGVEGAALQTPETLDAWIDPHNLGDQALLDAVASESDFVAGEVEFHKVNTAVGSVKNNNPELILPL